MQLPRVALAHAARRVQVITYGGYGNMKRVGHDIREELRWKQR